MNSTTEGGGPSSSNSGSMMNSGGGMGMPVNNYNRPKKGGSSNDPECRLEYVVGKIKGTLIAIIVDKFGKI